jgi:hypothetical protein
MITFIKSNKHGSGIELGDNISYTINTKYESRSIHKKYLIENINDIKNNIIVFIKYIDYSLVEQLKNQNNKIYFFIVDDYPSVNNASSLDGIIYSNNQQRLDFNQFFTTQNNHIYYHHYSPFYNNILSKNKNIGYFVAPENISNKLKNINIVEIHTNFNEYKNYISEYFFHIEYRDKNCKHFLYKPCTKLSTSSFAESVFICSKDKSYIELLPNDYPFFLTEDMDNIDMVLEKFINSRGTDYFKYSIDIILKLKNKLSIHNTSNKLLEFLTS